MVIGDCPTCGPIRAKFDRLRAEVEALTKSQEGWHEDAIRWSHECQNLQGDLNTLKAKVQAKDTRIYELEQEICAWQASHLIDTGQGDPDGLTPAQAEACVQKDRRRIARLRALLKEIRQAPYLDDAQYFATRALEDDHD